MMPVFHCYLLVALAMVFCSAPEAQAACGACVKAPRNDTTATAYIAAEAARLRDGFNADGAAAFEAKCREKFAAAKCDADLAAFAAADVDGAVSLFRHLLLETFTAKANVALESAAAAKAAEPFVESAFVAAVDASLERADAAQVDLEARTLLYASTSSHARYGKVQAGLADAASAAAARVARFDAIRANEAALSDLVAAAMATMSGNVDADIVALQNEIKAQLRAANLDTFMLENWLRQRERLAAVNAAVDALAANHSVLRIGPDAPSSTKHDIRVLLAELCCGDGGQRMQDALARYADLSLVKSGTFDYEIMCLADELVDAALHSSCAAQLGQLAVEVRIDFDRFTVFAVREFDFGARDFAIDHLDWRAPREWLTSPPSPASTPGCDDVASIERKCGNFAESREAAPLFAAISAGKPIADGSAAAAACDALGAYRRCKAEATPAGCELDERECEKSAHDLRDIGCAACDDSAAAAEERALCSAAENNCCGAPGVESGDRCAPQAASDMAIDARVRCVASRCVCDTELLRARLESECDVGGGRAAERTLRAAATEHKFTEFFGPRRGSSEREPVDSGEIDAACDAYSAYRRCKARVQGRACFDDSFCKDRGERGGDIDEIGCGACDEELDDAAFGAAARSTSVALAVVTLAVGVAFA